MGSALQAPGSGASGSRRALRTGLAVAAAVALLNGLLSFNPWWPTPAIVPDHRLAPEFVWTWVLLLAWTARRGTPGRVALALLAGAYALLVIGRYIDVMVPALFGRSLNVYWDVPQIPRFLWVTAQERPVWQLAAAVVAVVAGLAALHALLRWALGVLARVAAPVALRHRGVQAATLAAVVLVLANHAGVQATWPVVSRPVLPTYWKQAELLATAASPERLARALPRAEALDAALAAPPGTALAALRGRDVYIVFLESVGAVVHDHPVAVRQLAPARAALADAIRASGRHVVSAFVRSPTIGGASDLAHLSLLSGVDLSDPRRHDLLLTTERPTLMSLFRAQGYQTFGLYPAVSWEWPERAYYGFDVYLEGRTLGYRGPGLGPWLIPDQFSIARLEQLHPRRPGDPPRLVFFPTITSHLPFSPVPPYQPDWARVLEPDPFDADELRRSLDEQPDWLNMFPDYVRMVEYTYRWLSGWFAQPEPREAVVVLVGDHQPTANVTGEGVRWDVPVHVVSRDPALLAGFEAAGFAPGLEPPSRSLGGLHDLNAMLVRAFGAAGGGVRHADSGRR